MSTPDKKDMERRARDALQMLDRAKSGHDPLDTLDGSGPVNEWVAIGYAKSALRRALGLPPDQPTGVQWDMPKDQVQPMWPAEKSGESR
jgi:hypothetical protein